MKVSIALCTYNGETYLPMQLESYLNQSKLPDELVVCDDKSTDQTIEILHQFQEKAPFPVRIHINDHQMGHAENFLQCMSKCVGDIILFSDQDDVWLKDKINLFYDTFQSDPLYRLAFSNAELIDAEGNIIVKDYFGVTNFYYKWDYFKPLEKVMAKNYGFVNGLLLGVQRRFVNDILHFFDEFPNYKLSMGHDHFFGIMAGLLYEPNFIKEIPYVLVQYRQHENQVIGATYSGLGNRSTNEVISDTKLKKHVHLNSFINYLTEFKNIANLLGRKSTSLFLADSITLHKQRLAVINAPIWKKLLFALSHLLRRKYHKYTQYPLKEAVRDIL